MASGGETLSYTDIAAWADLFGVPLDPWEAHTLRLLSGSYMAAAKETDKSTPPPYITPEGERARAQQASEAALRSWLA